jgi:hypothetical protein
MLVTLCVASSLALGGSTRLAGFSLEPRALVGPTTIMRPVLDTVDVSHDEEGVSYEELGWRTNSCLLCLFTAPARTRFFASSVCYTAGL